MRFGACEDASDLLIEFRVAGRVFAYDVKVDNTFLEIERTDNTLCLVTVVKACVESLSEEDKPSRISVWGEVQADFISGIYSKLSL